MVMVLSDKTILQEIYNGNIVMQGFKEENLNPNSYDMTLGSACKIYHPEALGGMYPETQFDMDSWVKFEDDFKQVLDCKKDNPTFEFKIPESGFVLLPNHLYLYSCKEVIGVHNDICATVMGKSSLGRLGLDIHVCAGFIDTGFVGSLVLEMRTIYPLRIYPDMKICQVKFERVDSRPREVYSEKKGSKYHGQMGVVESKYHKNFDVRGKGN